jgi:large subunit ribosomal protein L4
MATLTIRKPDGSNSGTLELSDAVFGVEPNAQCVRATVAQYLSNQRAGTHATKTRGFVSGGGRKPYKQKGTGRARQGSIRATQWRGGAIAFGPSPRDYSISVNRKVREKAFQSMWTQYVQEGRLIVVESFGMDKPSTQKMAGLLKTLGAQGWTMLLTEKTDEMMVLSARNIPWVSPTNCDNLNIYDLLNHDCIVATPEAVKRVEAMYS